MQALVRRFQASSLSVSFSWNECHRWWLSWVRFPLWEHHAPARHLCISGQQRQESAIELVSGLESGLYLVGLGLWSMKISSWQRVWTRYIITCPPFAAGMDETVSDCRSRRAGWRWLEPPSVKLVSCQYWIGECYVWSLHEGWSRSRVSMSIVHVPLPLAPS